MTNVELKEILINITKDDTTITEEMIDNVILENDINSLIKEASALLSFRFWDKTSPVNGASAELIKKDLPFTLPNWNGISYFVEGNGNIIYFQTTDYEKDGWTPILTEIRAKELADKQILNKAKEGAIYVILAKLRGE